MSDLVPWAEGSPLEVRGKILHLETLMREAIARGEVAEVTHDLPLRHSFIEGGYAREMTIPAGTLIVGKIHKYSCFNFVTRGRITVLTEDGVREIVAPESFVSAPGTKRVGYAHEDVVWTTVHVTDETDPEKVEDVLTVPDYEALP